MGEHEITADDKAIDFFFLKITSSSIKALIHPDLFFLEITKSILSNELRS
jgi:hypothetical protein